MAGYCKNIKITMTKDHWIKVEDDGRGIPTAIHEGEGISADYCCFNCTSCWWKI